ncbi:MAG: EF-hand domain-containing protein [Pseudomonadota bacterium]
MKHLPKLCLIAGLGVICGAAVAAAPDGARGPGHAPGHALDADGDGLITAEELNARNQALLEAADTDGDGAISLEEMRIHREKRREEARKARNPDKDGDGVISFAEFQDASTARFERLDRNGDGVLSEDEQPRRGRNRGPRGGGR